MSQKSPYAVIKSRYITEKATVLSKLKDATSNASVRRCESPKYIFIVDPQANKTEIADAIEEIYAEKNVKVAAVNTINVKPKQYNRRGNKNPGRSNQMKKAIVTLSRGDSLED
ncbi:MAG: ribosomal protein [Chlamydiia bacterium]|nr:ribosomal protein [Chlamydiia bacterium]